MRMGTATHPVRALEKGQAATAQSTPLARASGAVSLETMAFDPRDPANELYDQACSLLAAAQGLRAAARSRHAAPALAASLGCIEASLQQLREAMPELLDTALSTARRDRPSLGAHSTQPSEICASFATLSSDLSNTRTSCAAAREQVGPPAARL